LTGSLLPSSERFPSEKSPWLKGNASATNNIDEAFSSGRLHHHENIRLHKNPWGAEHGCFLTFVAIAPDGHFAPVRLPFSEHGAGQPET
jgi:hypothetical protein